MSKIKGTKFSNVSKKKLEQILRILLTDFKVNPRTLSHIIKDYKVVKQKHGKVWAYYVESPYHSMGMGYLDEN